MRRLPPPASRAPAQRGSLMFGCSLGLAGDARNRRRADTATPRSAAAARRHGDAPLGRGGELDGRRVKVARRRA
jgi:L,D-peptidoglycan transpeptidase YkuD (ErfK/YbiS/YcfS/YnhG family)